MNIDSKCKDESGRQTTGSNSSDYHQPNSNSNSNSDMIEKVTRRGQPRQCNVQSKSVDREELQDRATPGKRQKNQNIDVAEMEDVKPSAKIRASSRKRQKTQILVMEDIKPRAKKQGTPGKPRVIKQRDETPSIDPVDDVEIPVVSITSRHKSVRITINDLVFGGRGLAMYNTPEFRNQARNYAHAISRESKFDVVYGMIRSVRAKGGRFLYQAPKDKKNVWFDMSDSDAYNMILFRFHRAKIPKQRDGVGSILKINEADVLCPGSNCKDSRDHLGNDTFLDLVRPLCSAYKLATLVDRLAMCNSIVRSVQNRNGRFLGQDDTTGLWYELDQSDAQSRCYFSLHRHGTAKL